MTQESSLPPLDYPEAKSRFEWHANDMKKPIKKSGLTSQIQKRFLDANKPAVADAMAGRTDPLAVLPLRAVPKRKVK